MKNFIFFIFFIIFIGFSCTNKWDNIPEKENCTFKLIEIEFKKFNNEDKTKLTYQKNNLKFLSNNYWRQGNDSFSLVVKDSFTLLYHFSVNRQNYKVEKFHYNSFGYCYYKENFTGKTKTESHLYSVLSNGICFKESIFNNNDFLLQTIEYLYEKDNLMFKRYFSFNNQIHFKEEKFIYSNFLFKSYYNINDILLNHKHSKNLPLGYQNGTTNPTVTYNYKFTKDSLVESINDNYNNLYQMKYECLK